MRAVPNRSFIISSVIELAFPLSTPLLLEEKLAAKSVQLHSLTLSEALPDDWKEAGQLAKRNGVVLPDYQITFYVVNIR